MQEKKKSILIAILLNLLFIGAGHYYIKDTKKAFVFFPIVILTFSLMYYLSTLVEIGVVVGLIYLLYFSLHIYLISDVIKRIKNEVTLDSKTKDINLLYFICGYILFLVLIYVYSPMKIYRTPSKNMATTIVENDNIVVNKLDNKIKRGDIVAFRYPQDEKVHYVKRCVATEDDEILFQDKHLYIHFAQGDAYIKENYPAEKIVQMAGKLWVDNPYKEQFLGIHYDNELDLFSQMSLHLAAGRLSMKPALIQELSPRSDYPFNAFYTKVEKGHFYMVGDNRDHSNDSRFWGSVPEKNIIGKVGSVWINFSDLTRMGKRLQ